MRTLDNRSKSVLVWSLVISVLAAVASILGLTDPSVYAKETENWTLQAKGQDLGNLLAAAILVVSGYLYAKGSFKASLVWLGTLFYFVYAYLVYAMAVHFNYLFLVYVAVLGLSVYAVIFNLYRMNRESGRYPDARRLAGYTLLGIGSLFGLLWLSELIPALLQGEVPPSTEEAGLWVNPIHVIDLSVVLPGFIITGYLLLRGKVSGYFFAAPWLAFSVLMGSSIIAAMALIAADGSADAIPPMVMVSAVVGLSLLALWRYLRNATS